MIDSTAIQNKTDELEKRLLKMDLKLQKAKRARDEYVHFLRQKYPHWKPPELHTYKQLQAPNQFQRPLLESLATSKYHWNLGKRFVMPNIQPEFSNLEPNDPIPSRQGLVGELSNSICAFFSKNQDSEVFFSGPALDPDLIRIKKRLTEIAEDLDNLREHRLHLSTADYYLSLRHGFCSSKNQETPEKSAEEGSSITQLKSLHNLRMQIKQIDTHITSDTPSPKAEDYEWMREECLQKNTVKKTENQNKRKFAQVLADQTKNSRTLSKDSNYSERDRSTEPNMVSEEISNFGQMLNVLNQADNQNSRSQGATDMVVSIKSKSFYYIFRNRCTRQKIALEKQKLGETDSTTQVAHAPATTDSGFNFLARILGTSADGTVDEKLISPSGLNDKISKTVELNDEDSDSDFFA
uniref:Uncharacterized protein n=1 Tax=Setaria digitata TaxID=48799 RepID=A0A915PQP3_9BILA